MMGGGERKNAIFFSIDKKKCMKSNYINAEISSRKDLYIDLEKVVLHPLTNIIRKRYSGFPTGNKQREEKKKKKEEV